MALHKLNLEQVACDKKGIKVLLDDMEIHGVTKLDLNLDVFEVPTVTMQLNVISVTAGLNGVKFDDVGMNKGGSTNGSSTI